MGRATGEGDFDDNAFIWTEDGGMQYLSDYLLAIGVDTQGVHLTEALGISDDGSTIFGAYFGSGGGTFIANITTIPTPQAVTIDIKPRKDPNIINLKSRGFVPVAVLTGGEFDALQVDPATVKFGPDEQSPKRSKIQDYNRDGFPDQVLTFQPNETGIACGDTSATLTGETYGGGAIQGSDTFTVTPCP